MKSLFSICLFLIFLFVGPVSAHAANYYFDCNGADTNLGTSENSPWKSLTKLDSLNLNPGDNVLFKTDCSWDTGMRNNNLSENVGLTIDSAGTLANPVVYSSYGNGQKPRLFNSFSQIPYVYTLHLTGSYNIVKNITIDQATEAGVVISKQAKYNTLENLNITKVGNGIYVLGNNNTIKNNSIYDLKMFVNTPSPNYDDSGAVAVVISGSDNLIIGNQISNAISTSYDFGVDGGAFEFFGFSDLSLITRNKILYNRVENSDGVFEIGSLNSATVSNNLIAYNLLINNGLIGVVHSSGSGFQVNLSNLEIYNNTIYENSSEWVYKDLRYNLPMISITNQTVAPENITFKNNIVYTNLINQFSNQQITSDYNIYYPQNLDLGFGAGKNDIFSKPLFADVSGYNFSLTDQSLAIDSGTNEFLQKYPQLSVDIQGTILPQIGVSTALIDRGAYEFVLNISESPQPVSICLASDINQDSVVSIQDFSIMANVFGEAGATLGRADINQDQLVDISDFSILLGEFGEFKSCQPI